MENSKLIKERKFLIGLGLTLLGIILLVLSIVLKFQLPNSGSSKFIYYTLNIIGAIVIFFGIGFLYKAITRKTSLRSHTLSTKEITMIGIQSAISVILYYFVKINIPLFPQFLDLQVSEIPALITSFAYGPYAGSLVLLIRFFVKLPATITGTVGEFADLAIGLVLVITSGIFYKKHKTLKGALIGTAIGMVFATILACILNWLVLIPAYIHIAGFSMELILGACYMIPNISEVNFMPLYIFVGVLPFNLMRYAIVFLLTFLLYKRIHRLINRITR